MKKPIVLLVDDHEALQETITQALIVDGYDVVAARSSNELLAKLPNTPFDIVLLDLILPDADGLSLISVIREYTDVPIIVISSKSEMTDRVVGLEMGADDYVSKPLALKELSARVKAHLRRYNALQEAARRDSKNTENVKFGRWTLDRMRVQVYDENGNSCNLSAKEFRMLESLVNAPDRVLSREQILNQSRPDDYDITDRAVDVQVLRIRKKIGDTSDADSVIQTVRGIGYMFSTKTAASRKSG